MEANMKTYRVAIVGLGRAGSTLDEEIGDGLPHSVAGACQTSERLECVAGADTIPERVDAFRERWGIDAGYSDYKVMIEREKPDMVAVCTTATGLAKPARRAPSRDYFEDSHADISAYAAGAGVPLVYSEKAMACSMAKADFVRDACHENGTVFNTGVLRRFSAGFRRMRELVDEGQIGDPVATVHYAPSDLLHGHIHSIDTQSYLVGDPGVKEVKGELVPRDTKIEDNRLDADPHATFQLAFNNGVTGWTVPSGNWEFEVLGTKGTVRHESSSRQVALRKAAPGDARRAQWEPVDLAPIDPGHGPVVAALEDMVDAYESGRPSLGNVDVTHNITEACLAIAESHRRGGGWVELPFDNRELYVFHV
jgi:predicted dehydrogenase